MARSKIIINGEIYIDLTSDTAVASDVASGKTFHLADGTQATGTATGGSNDFIVTLSYNDTTEMWEPDKTYAEIESAYNAGKAIAVQCDSQSVQNYIVTDGYYSANERALNYIVSETSYDNEHGVDELRLTSYYIDSNGVGLGEGTQYIIPSNYKQITANGSSIDVTYCSEVDVAVPFVTYYTGSSTPSSSLGTDGDIYLKVVN